MSRFWRFENNQFPGEFYYLDPAEIVVVEKEKDEESGTINFCVLLKSGESYVLSDTDGAKMMKWAESEAEDIPVIQNVSEGWK